MGGERKIGCVMPGWGHRRVRERAQRGTGGYADRLDRLKRERDRLGVSLLPGDGKLGYGGECWDG